MAPEKSAWATEEGKQAIPHPQRPPLGTVMAHGSVVAGRNGGEISEISGAATGGGGGSRN
jgi:hypothetical protein